MNFGKKIFFVLMSLLVLIGITACLQTEDAVIIKFTSDTYTVKEGQLLAVDIDIDAAANLDEEAIRKQLVFSSSDNSVATFVDGKLLGVGYGVTTIKVEWSEKVIVFDRAVVTVLYAGLPEVVVGEYDSNMLKGTSQQLTYSFNPALSDADVVFESANPDIAVVDENGLLTAVGAGEATILVSSTDGVELNTTAIKVNVVESDYAINYVLDGGTNHEDNLPGYNTLVTPIELKDASKAGYTFEGWFADPEFSEQVTEIAEGSLGDITVYAKFAIVTYAISYELNGGAAQNPETYTVEDEIELADAAKDGYEFAGWKDADGNVVEKIEKGTTGDLALTANYEAINYSITYVLGEGETNGEGNPETYTVEDEITFAPASKEGFKFIGFDDGNGNVLTAIAKGTTGDLTLTAVFVVSSFAINYDLDGGHFVLPYPYQSHDELVRDFIVDYNAAMNKTCAADGSDFFARSYGATTESVQKFFTETQADKWGWLYTYLSEVCAATDGFEAFPSSWVAYERGAINNFLNAFNPDDATQSQYGPSFRELVFEEYADKYLEKVEGVLPAPKEYDPNNGTIVPDPVKDEYTFAGWGTKITEIETNGNSNFWGIYKDTVFLFTPASFTNATFSVRIGLAALANGMYEVVSIAQSGASFTKTGDLFIVLSESHNEWAGYAAFRNAIALGQQVVIDGDIKTGCAKVSFYEMMPREEAASIETSANSNFWGVYKTNVFLFAKGSVTNATFSFRVGIDKQLDGTYLVGEIAQSGASFTAAAHDFVLVISESHNEWASFAEFRSSVAVGQIVQFDGDPKSGAATVHFIKNSTTLAPGGDADVNLSAVFVQIKDENELNYVLDGATLSEGAPVQYLTSTGLVLTATAEKAGYNFLGWSLSKGGELITEIAAGTRGDLDLYPVFEAIEYQIEFDPNGGAFEKTEIINAYESFDALVADFLADYAAKYGLTGLTAANFNSKSASYGLVSFFKDETLGAKWAWLENFMINYNPVYSGLSYMKNSSNATNYNKYWRANIAAFLQQTKLSSPLTMDFAGIDTEEFWVNNGLKVTIQVIVEVQGSYTVDDLPLELPVPIRDGHEFVGWCDNEYFKREMSALPVGTLGDVKLYAKWDDTQELVEMKKINYVLDGGQLGENSPAEFEVDKGVALVDAERPGYEFLGWSVEEGGTEYITSVSTTQMTDITLYANWKLIEYTLEYELGEASWTYHEEIETEVDDIAHLGAKVAEITATATSGFWGGYKTNVFLFAKGSITNATFSFRVGIVKGEDGVYRVSEIAQSGESTSTLSACDYAIVISADGAATIYPETEEFRNAVQVGQIVEIDEMNLSFFAPAEAKASIDCDANSDYWSNYTSHVFLFTPNTLAKALWSHRIGINKVGSSYVVAGIGVNGAGTDVFDYNFDYIVELSSSHTEYAALLASVENVAIGDVVEFDGDPDSGVATVKFFEGSEYGAVKVTQKTVIDQEVVYPTTYTVEQLPLELPTPIVPEGKKFVGWYLDEHFYTAKLLELPLGTLGNIKLYARVEAEDWVEPTYSNITYELDGGVLENPAPIYGEGSNFELPTPTKEGFVFLGWLLDKNTTDFITHLGDEVTGDVTVYAIWYEEPEIVTPEKPELLVGEGLQYETIKAAFDAAEEGDVIRVAAGTYNLNFVINKSITIIGAGQEETIVNVATGLNNLAAAEITLKSMKFVGVGANSAGRYFQTTSALEHLVMDDISAEKINTFLAPQGTNGATAVYEITNSHFISVGQFIIWTYANTAKEVIFTGNTVDCDTCGTIENNAGSLIRIRCGAAKVYDNYFKGNCPSNGGLFASQNDSQGIEIMFNTFEDCTNIVCGATNINMVFDQNLYISSGSVLDAAPSAVAGTGVTADAEVAESEAARAQAYALFVNGAGKLVVGAGQTYETIAAALEAAQEGDTLYVLPGTYADALVINKAVTIQGANFGKAGEAGREGEAEITGTVQVKAAGVTLDGLKFSGSSNVDVYGGNFLVQNSVFECQFASVLETNRKAQITFNSDISNVKVLNNYFNVGESVYCKGAIGGGYDEVADVVIEHNYFTNEATAPTVSDCIVLYGVSGEYSVSYNTFAYVTDDYDIFLGNSSNSCTLINIIGNKFIGVDDTSYTAGSAFRKGKADSEVNIIGNEFTHCAGNTLNFANSASGAIVNVKYNIFNSRGFKMSNSGSSTVNFEENYYGTAQVHETSDYDADRTAEEVKAAYEAWLAGQGGTQEVVSKINYHLNGGAIDGEIVYVYTEGKKVALPKAKLADHRFLGWTLTEDGSEYLTEIAKEQTGDLELYAQFRFDGLTVGAGQDYETLEAALEAAKEGDVIYLFPGEYALGEEESFEVTVANLTIRGTEHYGKPAEASQADESIIKSLFKVSAAGLTLDGVRFDGAGCVAVTAGNFTVQNCVFTGTFASVEGTNRLSQIVFNAAVSNVKVVNSYFNAGASVYCKGAIGAGYSEVTNIVIEDNYFTNEATAPTISDCIIMYAVGGVISVSRNVFAYVTDDYDIYLGGSSNNASLIDIIDNEFIGVDDTAYTAGSSFRRGKAGSEINIIGNVFTHCAGNTFNFASSASGAVVNVMYNIFNSRGFKMSNSGSSTVNFVDNYYGTAQVHATSDYDADRTVEDVEAAYAAYLEAESQKVYHNISYVLNGGSLAVAPKAKFAEGLEFALPTPTRSGWTFLGWTLEEGSKETIMVIPATQAADVTVYARFVQYATVAFELDGGDLGTERYTPAELGELFVEEFNAFAGTELDASELDSDNMSVTKFGNFFKEAANLAKWSWLLDAVWEIDGKPESYKSDVCDFGDVDALGFYLANLNGFFTSTQHKDTWIETLGADYSIAANSAAVVLAAPVKSQAEVPSKYIKGEGLELPVPTKDGYTFMGYYLSADFSGDPVFELDESFVTDVTLYALWQIEGTFNVTYVLNGGNTLFANRKALTDELLADFNKYVGKSCAYDNFFDRSYGITFGQATAFFTTDEVYSAKWGWLWDYFQEMKEANPASDFASEVAEVRGFLHNFLNANKSCQYGGDYSQFKYANGFWSKMQDQVSVEGATSILTPYYPYYTFLGWYDNAELTGEAVRSLTGDCTLYAKFAVTEYELTYVLNNNDASLEQAVVKFNATQAVELATPTYNPKNWIFDGWFSDPECTLPIELVPELTENNVTVYAKWTVVLGYTITYVLNGGSIKYADRDAVVADFIKDYNEAMDKSYTPSTVPTGSWDDINYHTFYTKVLSDGTNIRTKWLWLAKYLLAVSKRDLASNNCNVLGLTKLVNESGYSGDDIYGLSYAFRAFLAGTTVRPGGSYSSVDFSVYENAHGFWSYLSEAENNKYINNNGEVTLLEAHLENMDFVGWFDNAECTGDPITVVDDAITVYAKYTEGNPVTGITVSNLITEIERFATHQLQWTVEPANANVKTVVFSSSDSKVLAVGQDGMLEALSCGKATITITSSSQSGFATSFEVEVFAPDHFEIGYETESYLAVGEEIQLNAEYIKRDGSSSTYTWSSLNTEIATVDEAGKVTGVAEGVAQIRCAVSDEIFVDFYVTVLPESLSNSLNLVLKAHNSNLFTRYNLGIGAGTPAYYRDIIGSISQLLYNEEYVINRQYESVQAGISSNHGGKMSSVEFITVHYTGNMAVTSTASANANYFAGGGGGTSIHYVVGNDGIFHVLDDTLVGYHAGDGTGVTFEWIATGIDAPAEGDQTPVWGINTSSHYTINGQDTGIKIPDREDGIVVTGLTFEYNGMTLNSITDTGLPWKVEGGKYYMGTTWWCYTQKTGGCLCSKGGNNNSIGIESAVNPETDLWYTWHKLAQLVAHLMVENNLDITRVKLHNAFSGKDCHQPFLANNLEILPIFLDMVELEYEKLTQFQNATFTLEILEGKDVTVDANKTVKFNVYNKDYNLTWAPGRVMPNEQAQVVTYKVTVTNGDTVEEITLATAVNSIYSEDASSPASTRYMGYVHE